MSNDKITPEMLEAMKALEASGACITGGRLKSEYDAKKDDSPSLHDIVIGNPAGQAAAQTALEQSMAVQASQQDGLRAILEKVSNRYATSVDKADLLSIDQAIAAIERLVPKEKLQPSRYYDKVERSHVRDYPTEFRNGYNAAIGDIRRNFKGDK